MGLDIYIEEYEDGKRASPAAYLWVGRLVGEKAFAAAPLKMVFREGQDPYDYSEYRFQDFAEARCWVNNCDAIPSENKPQFIEMLNAVESNPNLWIGVSP